MTSPLTTLRWLLLLGLLPSGCTAPSPVAPQPIPQKTAPEPQPEIHRDLVARAALAQPAAAPATATAVQAEPTASAVAPPPPQPLQPPPPPKVEVSEPSFIGDGEVPQVKRFLERTLSSVADCVADHGGLSGRKGWLKAQLLVRLAGRAEGVEVLDSKGVSAEAERCVRKFLKHKRVGVPTNDPVGVQVRYLLEAARD